MSLPDPLMFTVGLIDQITKPIAKISQQFNGLSANYQQGTMQMGTGIAGMVAGGYALQNALMPAIEMDRVLGEVKSLGVAQSALDELSSTSYEYALKYGKSATEFVSSSYDIQSAIAGLSDADLSAFTLSSNVLATATKADAATITNYMGTMYGIFKNDAAAMGKSNWVEQVTGMTATAVQAFKTTGAEMSGAFTSIGAEANSAGIGMHEQMAILGTLQATMSGSESGTKYKAFLAGVGKAQAALNLSFTDSQGAMLPMVDILNQIKGKYGETFDVAESDALAKAFGSSEAVSTVKLLMGDIDGLSDSINTLGQVKGMGKAEEMAAAMTDQSERLAQSWYVIRAAFGSAVLPAFNEFVGVIADLGQDVLWFTQMFPNLTKYIGYAGIAIMSMVIAGGAFTVMMGAGKMAMTAYGVAALAWAGINTALTAGMTSLRGVMLAVNIAMYANPIGLIVAGVAALVVGVIAAVYWFDDLKSMLADTAWGAPIIWAGEAIAGLFSNIGGLIGSTLSAVIAAGKMIWTVISPVMSVLFKIQMFFLKTIGVAIGSAIAVIAGAIGLVVSLVSGVFSAFGWVADGIGNMFNGVAAILVNIWGSIEATFIEGIDWIIDKLNMIPGVDIAMTSNESAPTIDAISPIKSNMMQGGGITNQIANANQRSTSVGSVNVYPQTAGEFTFADLEMHLG